MYTLSASGSEGAPDRLFVLDVGRPYPRVDIDTDDDEELPLVQDTVESHLSDVSIDDIQEEADLGALSRKQLKALAREQIGVREQRVKELRKEIKACESVLDRVSRTGRLQLSVGKSQWRAKQKAPIGERMASYMAMTKLKKERREEKRAIRELKNFLKSPVRQVLEETTSLLLTGRKRYRSAKSTARYGPLLPKSAMTSASTGVAITKLFNPWMWYKLIVEEIIDFSKSVKATHLQVQEAKALRALIKEGNRRLEELPQVLQELDKLSDNLSPTTRDEYKQSLDKEGALLREALDDLQFRLDNIPVVDSVAGTVIGGVGMVLEFSVVTQVFAAVLPAALNLGSHAMSVAGTVSAVASIVSAPMAAILLSIGVPTTIDNIRTSIKDLSFLRRYGKESLGKYRGALESMANIVSREDLNVSSEARAIVEAAAQKIEERQQEIARIDHALLQGEKDKRHIDAYKEARQICQADIASTRQQLRADLMHHSDDEGDDVAPLLDALEVQWVAEDSARDLDEVLYPYLKEKVLTKVISVAIRSFFDVVMVVSTGLAIGGFFGTLAGGAGAPILAAAGILGLVGGLGQIASNIIVERLRKLQCRKKHVNTSSFNDKLLERIKVEVQNWDKIEAAGMTEMTTAHVMFQLLKRNYDRPAGEWGPKEWAQNLVENREGVAKEKYDRALKAMRDFDRAGFLHRVVLWPARRLYRRWVDRA